MRKLMGVLLFAFIFPGGYVAAEMLAAPAVTVKQAKKCVFPKSKKRAPSWVCDVPANGFAVGSAAKSKAGLAFMEQMASADARAKLVPMRGAAPQNAVGAVAVESLEGSRIIKRAYGPNGTLYVLMGLGESGAK